MSDSRAIAWPTKTPISLMSEGKYLKVTSGFNNLTDPVLRAEGTTPEWDSYLWVEHDEKAHAIRLYHRGHRTNWDEDPWYMTLSKLPKGGWWVASFKPGVAEHDLTSVFSYYVHPNRDEKGRYQVVLKLQNDLDRDDLRNDQGRFLGVGQHREICPITYYGSDPRCIFAVDEPMMERWIEFLRYEQTEDIRPIEMSPAINYRATIVNPGDSEVTKEFAFTHEKETVGTWNHERALSLAAGASFTVGTPDVAPVKAEATLSFEVKTESRQTWGRSEGEKQAVEDRTTVVVPPHSELEVHILAQRYKVDIPFTYDVHRTDIQGNALPTVSDRGIYTAVPTLGTEVEVEQKPLSAPPAPRRDTKG